MFFGEETSHSSLPGASATQAEWLGALNEQRERIRSLHSLVVQLSATEDAPAAAPEAQEKQETDSAKARERTYEEKYKRAKNLLKVQAQHVSQLQGAGPALQ